MLGKYGATLEVRNRHLETPVMMSEDPMMMRLIMVCSVGTFCASALCWCHASAFGAARLFLSSTVLAVSIATVAHATQALKSKQLSADLLAAAPRGRTHTCVWKAAQLPYFCLCLLSSARYDLALTAIRAAKRRSTATKKDMQKMDLAAEFQKVRYHACAPEPKSLHQPIAHAL
jgi:hypothetical protein